MKRYLRWLKAHREPVAWLVVLTTMAVCIFSAVQFDSTSSQERKALMEVNDMMQTRLTQQVSALATVHPQIAGKGATASVDGNDAVGQVNINTGSNPVAGSLVHITFHTPYSTSGVQPIVALTPLDQSPPPDWYVTVDWYGFDIVVGAAPKPNTNYPFAYIVAPRPWAMYLNEKP